MPTKFRLPNLIPIVRTKIVDLTNRSKAEPTSLFGAESEAVPVPPVGARPSVEETAPPAVENKVAEGPGSDVAYQGGHQEQAQDSEFSFNYKLSALERFAVESARANADAGLPRMNVECPDELPIENHLRARASEIFIDWKSRSLRKAQDALQKAVLDAGNGVVALRHALDQARLAQFKVSKVERDLERTKAERVGKSRTVAYDSHLAKWGYITIVAVLAAVEWIANTPVFRALLPVDNGADRVLKNLSDESENVFWLWGGMQRLIAKITVSPEAGILAIGAIGILLYLTHVCGENGRRLVAFNMGDDPGIAHGMVSELRQAKNAFWFSLLGIAAILLFLTFARGSIAKIAERQYADAKTHTAHVVEDYNAAIKAGETERAQFLSRQVRAAQSAEQGRRDNLDYATSISTINVTIILLNFGLVVVASIAAYQRSSGALTEIRVSDPAMVSIQTELEGALSDLMACRHKVRTLDLDIQSNLARAHHLSRAKPTESWMAKVERLNSVVPLYRATNSTIRGVDPQNILAFAVTRGIDVFPPEPDVLHPPDGLSACERELERLRSQFDFMRTDMLASDSSKGA